MLTPPSIVNQALSFGYDKCGIVSTATMKGYADKVHERIARSPEM